MSLRRISERFLIPVLITGFLTVLGCAPSFAQTSSGFDYNAQTQFPMIGTSINVLVGGALPGIPIGSGCPFEASALNPNVTTDAAGYKLFQQVQEKARAGEDADGCPYYRDNVSKTPQPLPVCRQFYQTAAQKPESLGPDCKIINPVIACCAEEPGADREVCKALANLRNAAVNSGLIAQAYINSGTKPDCPGIISLDQSKQMDKNKKAKDDADQQCIDVAWDKIGTYWAQRREVKCVKDITHFFTNAAWTVTNQEIDEATKSTQTGSSNSIVVGSSPGAIVSTPSPYAEAAALVRIFGIGRKTATTMIKIASELSQSLDDCSSISGGLSKLTAFRKSLEDSFSCKAMTALIERQLTQCVRTNFNFDLSLPNFSIMLQCPINVNFSLAVGPGGFKCYSSTTVGSPVTSGAIAKSSQQASFSGSSVGGLSSLFSGDCFGTTSNKPSGSSSSTSTSGLDADGRPTRTPGVDCGKLDTTNPLKQQQFNGTSYLAAGPATTTGWVVGGSEQVPQIQQMDQQGNLILKANGDPATVAAANAITITRCDYYDSGKLKTTNYVYGSGASCNAGTTGFQDGGYETNIACYGSSNYVPAAAPNIPDACMYPAACLDASGNFSQALVGKSNCPTGVIPTFNANNTYGSFTTTGFDGGSTQPSSCSAFSKSATPVTICCDPQKQDCTTKDANTPLCVCDQGDAQNTIIRDPVTNELDKNGACVQGGAVTCCSPRLNGTDWCNANMGANSICAAEREDQCVGAGVGATYTGPDGQSKPVTASDLVLAKPSPYIYLFVRPDAQINGQECCMTEWCNICPQHYANAYGLSMARSSLASPPKPYGTLADKQYDSYNNSILGKGWPYVSRTDSLNITSFTVGVNPISLTFYDKESGVGDPVAVVPASYLPLMMSPDAKQPLTDAVNACNNLSNWKVIYGEKGRFDSAGSAADFGYIYDNTSGHSDYTWTMVAPVPTMDETPLAYMNRIRGAVTDSNSQPLPEIPLCSKAVKICLPGDNSSPLTSTIGHSAAPVSVNTPTAGTGTTTTSSPATTTAPTTTTTTTTTSGGSSSTGSGGATVVPSAGGDSSGREATTMQQLY